MAEQHDVSFKLLSLLSKERGVYGLRNGDHERYRRHCTNKVQRLRQVTGLSSGKGKVYKKPPPITAASIKDARPLQLLLFSAERALAHSHQLKATQDARKEQISWLRRALQLSTSLHSVSTSLGSRLNARTLSEVTVYNLSLRAELHFERSQWAEALTALAVRRRLLSTIGQAARDSYDQALAAEFTDAYDPLIRFSAFKLGRAESHDIEGVMRDIDDEMQEEALPGVGQLVSRLRQEVGSAEMEAGRRTLDEVEFAGEKVEMRSAEIVQAMVKVQEVIARQIKGMRGWDKVLAVLGEAEAVARKLVDDHEASGSTTPHSAARAHQYITHLLLSYRIRRDLQLVDTLQASAAALPTEHTQFKVPGGKTKLEQAVKALGGVVKLYDAVLQSVGQVRALPLVEERDEVRVGVEGAESFFRAARNYHLARLHCIHPEPSYASAVRLLARSLQLAQQARSALATETQEPIAPVGAAELDVLDARLTALDAAAKRALFADRVEKPVFFDTAFNYVDLPMDDLLRRAGKPATLIESVKPAQVEKVVRNTRESTPAVTRVQQDEQDEDEDDTPQQKKGWLGGWFGRS